MTKTNSVSLARIALASTAALLVAACSSTGQYRVGAVGDVPGGTASADGGGDGGAATGTTIASTGGGTGGTGAGVGGSTGGTGSGSGSGSDSGSGSGGVTTSGFSAPLLVSAGNAVIGVAGRQNALGQRLGGLPATGRVNGVVTAVLQRTGQTLVDVGGGRSVVLNRAAGRLGDAVAIDLGSHKVVGAPTGSALLGLGVASASPPTGTLGSVNVASGGLGAITGATGTVLPGAGSGSATAIVPQVVNTATSVVSGTPIAPIAGAVPTPAPITRPVTGIVAGVGLGAGAGTTTGSGTTSGGALGVGGLVRIRRP